MANLIIVVISIILSASVIATTVVHLPLAAIQTYKATKAINHGYERLEPMIVRYLQSNRDGQGQIIAPAPGIDIGGLASPAFGYMPPIVPGFHWYAVSGVYQAGVGVGLCLLPDHPLSPGQKKAVDAAFVALPQGGAVRGSSCNEVVDSPNGQALTYWVLVSQLQ